MMIRGGKVKDLPGVGYHIIREERWTLWALPRPEDRRRESKYGAKKGPNQARLDESKKKSCRKKREILPDYLKYGNKVVSKFINMLMEDGKKATAERNMLWGI